MPGQIREVHKVTRDQVLQMAREIGMHIPGVVICDVSELEKFAALVAEKERESCALVCSMMPEMIAWRRATHDDCALAIRARGSN